MGPVCLKVTPRRH